MMLQSSKRTIPRQGDSTDLFERLSEYITLFKRSWSDWIKPASKESIERLKEVSEYKKWTDTFPVDYEMFLEKMGDDDDGLLSGPLLGVTKIENVIELYEEDSDGYWLELLSKPYLAFLSCHMGGEYSICLRNNGITEIVDAEVISNVKPIAESFEKLLFQCAFQKYERYRYYVSYGADPTLYMQALQSHKTEDVFDIVDAVANKFGMEKAWFSDANHYIAFGDRINFIIYTMQPAAVGFVTGDNRELLLQISEALEKEIGVFKHEQSLW